LGFLFEAFVGGVACEGSLGSILVVAVLPFLKLVAEEVDVVDDLVLEEPVELFRVDPVGSLELPVEPRRGRFYTEEGLTVADRRASRDLPSHSCARGWDRKVGNGTLRDSCDFGVP
jgi:hypothetical protein